ncbi:MAG: ribosomal-processing cysteine protease Prp [Spirochaetales bacterium]|nr:ribosomal-processing cysteine protease Prp [Spirochaetales bacterium]MCF7937987.1 ribosomal-processing cysteine protease Prp [Spirochaetales bacterium]
MIRVRLCLDEHGALKELRADGHSGAAPRGEDLVCAAASSLLRTVARLLEKRGDLSVTGEAGHEGSMRLQITGKSKSGGMPEEGPRPTEWLAGVTDTLLQGLTDLSREQPRSLELVINTEDVDGT